MTQVLDYSAGKPGAAAIKRAGYIGAVRYIGFPPRTKCTDAGELRDFTQLGLGMALVYQDGTGDALGGLAAGHAAARRARGHADEVGFPRSRPIYFAVDRDIVTEAQFRAVVAYLDGAGSVLGGPDMVGVYGERDVTVRARSAGVASWFWQTRAWSGTPVRLDPERHLYQRPGQVSVAGIQCDVNDVLRPDWGQHTKEDDMELTDKVKLNAWAAEKLGRKEGDEITLGGLIQYSGGGGWSVAKVLADLEHVHTNLHTVNDKANALVAAVADVRAKLDQVAAGNVDYAALAKAVNDDAAARLQA